MLKYLKQILSISLVFLITLGLAIPALGMTKPTIGLLKINNYNGVDTVGGNKLERLVVEEFVANIQKQGSVQFINHEKVKELMSRKNLDCYYQAADLCTVADLYSIGSELGMAQLLILDINGYSEVKREKTKKTINCFSDYMWLIVQNIPKRPIPVKGLVTAQDKRRLPIQYPN